MFRFAFVSRPRGGFFVRPLFLNFLLFFTMIILTIIFMPRMACAQTATPALPPIAIGWWLQGLLAVAAISIPAALGIFGAWLKAHFKLAAGSNAANIIDLLVTAGQQFEAGAIAKAPPAMSTITVKNAAVDQFLSELSDTTLAAMKLKGVTPASIAQRIDGALAMAMSVPTTPATPTVTTK